MTRIVEVRRGLYRDSVALMHMSHTVGGLPGVDTALIAMATPLNLDRPAARPWVRARG